MRLIDVVQKKMMSFVLQDLRCTRCREIKRENLNDNCSCAGTFELLITTEKMITLLETFSRVAKYHQMGLLQETIEQINCRLPSKNGG